MKYLSKFNIIIFIALSFYCAMAVAQVKPISLPTNIGKPPVVKKIKQNISVIAPDEEVEGEGSAVNESSIESEGGATVIKFSGLSATTANDFFTTFSSKLLITPNDTFGLLKKEQDNIGFTHYRFQQHFKGVPLDGVQFLLHEKNGKLTSANGDFFSGLDINTTASISKQEAIQKAIQFVGAEKYLWDNPKEEQFLKTIKKDLNATYYPKAELVIAPTNGIYAKENFRLCYRVNIFSEIPYDNVDVYIDALTGETINKIGKIAHADVTGTANTLYSGTKTISMENNAGTYRLRETSRPIQTFNMRNGTNYSDAVDFTNTSNNWTAKEKVLNSITISSVNNNWVDAFENTSNGGIPDIYIEIKDVNNNVIWTTIDKILQNTSIPVTLNASKLIMQDSQYTMNIYDWDSPNTSQLLGSFIINVVAGNFTFSANGTTGSVSIEERNNPALDVHWAMEKVYDFYLTKFNRNSYDNQGSLIKNYIHFGIAYNNAAWDPEAKVMVYGDGDGQLFTNLSGMDVV